MNSTSYLAAKYYSLNNAHSVRVLPKPNVNIDRKYTLFLFSFCLKNDPAMGA
jgi:hypothetical protein